MIERECYIALAYFGKIPSLKGLPILKRIGSATQFFNNSTQALQTYGITTAVATELVNFRKTFDYSVEQAKNTKEKIEIITLADETYPSMLRELPDAPYALFVRGSLISLAKPTIAIVGTRKASSYALHATEYFANELSKCGATIISGLALGVDAKAHETTVNNGGTTIAVLGGGISD